MTLGYGITGIGYNPLGNLGLGSTGAYASYDSYMPSMYGMNGSIFGMGTMNGMGGMNGMMNLYNPAFMAQMYQQAEASQLAHAGNMHTALLNNEVNAFKNTDLALTKKMLTNGDIQQGVMNLYNKVHEGDQDGICKEFTKLKNYVLNTYKDEFVARGDKINSDVSATQYIESVYSNIASQITGDGQVHDLRSDIKKYGESSFENGFYNGLRRDHHKRYIDETLNYCFGLQIDERSSKDMKKTIGTGIGRSVSVLEKGAYGAAAGLAATGTILGVGKLLSFGKLPFMKCIGASWKPALAIGALAGMAADIWWQCTKD